MTVKIKELDLQAATWIHPTNSTLADKGNLRSVYVECFQFYKVKRGKINNILFRNVDVKPQRGTWEGEIKNPE